MGTFRGRGPTIPPVPRSRATGTSTAVPRKARSKPRNVNGEDADAELDSDAPTISDAEGAPLFAPAKVASAFTQYNVSSSRPSNLSSQFAGTMHASIAHCTWDVCNRQARKSELGMAGY